MKRIFIGIIIGFCVIFLSAIFCQQYFFRDKEVVIVKKEKEVNPQFFQSDYVKITEPQINQKITSPVIIKGQALGTWFFEASLPIRVSDANHVVLGTGVAHAEGDWMTTSFVPFTATVNFAIPTTSSGFIRIEKDNPSGLPQNAASEEFPVNF